MELVKETADFAIYKKRNGRYGVKNSAGKWVNGEDKVKILLGEGLIKVALPAEKPAEEEEAAPAEAAEAPAEEAAPAE